MNAPDRTAVEARLREQYAGVFDEARLQKHLLDYLGPDVARKQVRTVSRRVPVGARILDVGCGYGSFLAQAALDGYDAVGVDLSRFELEYAAGWTKGEVLVCASGLSLPFRPQSFHAVTLWNVLEHVADTSLLLKEVDRVIRPDGLIFITAPNYATLRREAHYGIWWPPLVRKTWGIAYLNRRRRDPTFFRDGIFPCTNTRIRRLLIEMGYSLHDLTADKLGDPGDIANARRRLIAASIGRLRLARVAEAALRLHSASPIKGSIELVAAKRHAT